MDDRLAFEKHAAAIAAAHRGPCGIVEQALREITRRQQIFESLLVLNPDAITPEIVRQPRGRDIHFALQADLRAGEMLVMIGAGVEPHPARFHPAADAVGLPIAGLHRLVIERGLTEPLFENARRVQKAVREDRVEHSHAAFIEHAHDRFPLPQLFGESFAQLRRAPGDLQGIKRHDVIERVLQFACLEPRAKFAPEKFVGEILAPQRGVAHARLGQRSVQVQHSHEAGPLARPVGDS